MKLRVGEWHPAVIVGEHDGADRNNGAVFRVADELKKCHGELIRVAWRIVGERELAEDVVQEVFLAHLSGEHEFRGTSELKTYLYRIVINRCIDTQRRRNRYRTALETISREHAGYPRDQLEIKDLVRRLLAGIKPAFRVPFVLAGADGLTYEEIAEVLQLPVNTIRTRIYRCRELLKRKLVKMGYP
jgi:RNA polymerase sigma-70 factor (ECF subfamily)